MALTADQKTLCAAWVTSPNRTWQTLNRSQWKYQFREKTLVRYVEEAKMDEDIVPLLLEYLTSADCKATLQLYGQGVSPEWTPTRAWYEISQKSAGNVRAVRLYHAIAIAPANGEDGPYVVENGCAYKVSWTYYWKRSSVPPAPASTSGVSYRVVNVQPDPETGLFNYAIEKRERVQQDIEEYLTRTTQFEDVSEEIHLGVRGDLAAGGKQASVENGKAVTRNVTKNADCTHDVRNTTTQAKAVPESSVTVAVGLRGTSVTTENRNMPGPASTDGLAPGESVRNQKTDLKLWNQTIRKFMRDVSVWLRGTCRKTIFAHSHSETTNVKDNPGFNHAVEASNGVIHELSVHKTEEGFDVTDAVTEEKPVSEASESIHVGLDGTTRTVTHRNQDEPAPAPTEVGETVTNEKTQGGRWNQSIRSIVRTAFLRLGRACSKTIFSHSHSSTTVQGQDPGFDHVEEAGNGLVRRMSVTRTENGFRIEDGTTQEIPVRDAVVTKRMTLNGLFIQRLHRNQAEPAPDPTEIGKGVVNRETDGGRYDVTETEDGAAPAGKTGESCSRDNFTHRHSETRNEKDAVDPETSFEPGKIVRKSSAKTGNGTSNNTTETVTAVPQKNSYTYVRSDGAVVHVVKYHNQTDIPSDYPNGAVGLTVSDSVNGFDRHDGVITWLTNAPVSNQIGELKFVKRGKMVTFYEVMYHKRTRKHFHRPVTVQLNHICGDAYTDYLNDKMSADINRRDSGILCTRLIRGPYRDRDGNLLAEWEWVSCDGSAPTANNWVACDSACRKQHGDGVAEGEIAKAAMALMGSGGDQSTGNGSAGMNDMVNELKNLPMMLASAMTGQSIEQIKARMDGNGGAAK